MTATPLLTVPEVARRLSLSRAHTYRLIEHGQIGVVRVGRAVRVTEAAVTEFVESHTEAPLSIARQRMSRLAR